MAGTTPRQSFGSTEARNGVLGSQFSGTTNINFHGGPGKRPAILPPSSQSLILQTRCKNPKQKEMVSAVLLPIDSPREGYQDPADLRRSACLRSLAFGEIRARQHDIAPAYSDTCDWLF